MFARRDHTHADAGRVDLAFTDRHGGVSTEPFDSLDLSLSRPGHDDELQTNFALLAREFGVAGFATMRQVHGADVIEVTAPGLASTPCDGLITTQVDVALCVRVGDCVPVVLADAEQGVVGVAHAGRPGVVVGVVPATVDAMRQRGAQTIEAWIGPRVCGGCYEVPASIRDDVAAVVPAAYACTTWGTPSVDIGAAVHQQLVEAGCTVYDRGRCTMESADLYSHRRDQERSGRFAGVVVRRGPGHD